MTLKHVFDVVVIGAGLSGLQAAHVVKAAGLSVCVLEATGRVGGKTLTMQSTERGFNDLGAAWINDTSQSEMYKLYQRYGMEAEIQHACGNDVAQLADGTVLKLPFGQPLVYYLFISHKILVAILILIWIQGDPKLLQELLELLRAEGSKVDLENPRNSSGADDIDNLTFREFCIERLKDENVTPMADEICAALLGVQSDEVSALYMLHYFKSGTGIDNLLSDQKNGGQYLRNRQGMINNLIF